MTAVPERIFVLSEVKRAARAMSGQAVLAAPGAVVPEAVPGAEGIVDRDAPGARIEVVAVDRVRRAEPGSDRVPDYHGLLAGRAGDPPRGGGNGRLRLPELLPGRLLVGCQVTALAIWSDRSRNDLPPRARWGDLGGRSPLRTTQVTALLSRRATLDSSKQANSDVRS